MGYQVIKTPNYHRPRRGLEGPFVMGNGRVYYYDPKEGKYWDPTTDYYVPNEDMTAIINKLNH
jgi:hypothetical protein